MIKFKSKKFVELSSAASFEINPEDLAKSEGGDNAEFESGDTQE